MACLRSELVPMNGHSVAESINQLKRYKCCKAVFNGTINMFGEMNILLYSMNQACGLKIKVIITM